jgi:two-component system chemotaxis sensor kinase CheA
MDMSKYKPLFLSETGEHLDALESDLLALEQRPDDSERIHEAFRHLHSVKSMAASMDYEPLSQLAHRLEDVVAPLRDRGGALSDEAVELLLSGLDALRSGLEAAAADRPMAEPDAQLLGALERAAAEAGAGGAGAATAATGRAAEPAAAEPPPAAPEPADGAPDAAPRWRLRVAIDAGCSLPAVRAFVVHRRLSGAYRLLDCTPPPEQLRAGELPAGRLEVELAGARTAAELEALLATVPEVAAVEIDRLAPAGGGDAGRAAGPSAATAASDRPVEPVSGPASGPEALDAPSGPSSVRVRTELLDFIVDAVGELIALRAAFEDLAERSELPALGGRVRRLGKVVRRLQDRVMEVRMVPVSLLTDRLPRVCRDAARRSGKRVAFEVAGADVELDRALLETLDAPLLHLLRNAVEHGIEPPQQRRQLGKPAQGRVWLEIHRRQDRVLLRLSDDGRGLDLDRLAAKARQAGLLEPQQQLDAAAKRALVFQPGLSTRDEADALAGRGVGLDAVRDSLERVGGRVEVDSQPGRGTAFTLDLPLTLALLQTLLVEFDGHLLAVPASRVLRALAIDPELIEHDGDGRRLLLDGRRYPYHPLGNLLGAPEPARPCSEVLLVDGRDRADTALGVDRVTGHREAVLKPVGRLLHQLGPYNATTVLGDGQPVLLLDVDEMLLRAARPHAQED